MNKEPSDRFVGRHLWQYAFVQDVFWIGLAVAVLWFGYVLRAIFTPLLVAFGLAYLAQPLIHWLNRHWGVPRLATALGLLAVILLACSILVMAVGPHLLQEISRLRDMAPIYVDEIVDQLGLEEDELAENVRGLIDSLTQERGELSQWIASNSLKTVGLIGSTLAAVTYAGVVAFLVPIYFVYFGWQYGPIVERVGSYIPERKRDHVTRIARQMDVAVGSFLRGRILIAALMAVMFSLGWWMAGVPYWFLLGTLTGLLSIIPYLSAVGWPLAVVLKYLDDAAFSWMDVVFWPSLVFCGVQFVEGWVITPWVQSRTTSMSAATILIVVLIGGAVGGVYGLLLAIPLAACLKIFAIEVVVPRLERWAEDA